MVATNNFHIVSITSCTVASIHSIRKRTRNSQKLGDNLGDDKPQNKDSRVKRERNRAEKLLSLRKKKRYSEIGIHWYMMLKQYKDCR